MSVEVRAQLGAETTGRLNHVGHVADRDFAFGREVAHIPVLVPDDAPGQREVA